MVITFGNLKGGVGKSTLCLLLARYLKAAGQPVLVIDLDPQNSTTFALADSEEQIGSNSIANAIIKQDLSSEIVATSGGVDLVPSSLQLVQLRSIPPTTLRKLLRTLDPDAYPYILIDTGPSIDNFTLNAALAADTIVVPTKLMQFDLKTTRFYMDQLSDELSTQKALSYKVVINGFRGILSENPDNLTNQYLSLAAELFNGQLTPHRVPSAELFKQAVDAGEIISTAKNKLRVFSPLAQFFGELTGIPAWDRVSGDNTIRSF